MSNIQFPGPKRLGHDETDLHIFQNREIARPIELLFLPKFPDYISRLMQHRRKGASGQMAAFRLAVLILHFLSHSFEYHI